jgi:hypothetical protein
LLVTVGRVTVKLTPESVNVPMEDVLRVAQEIAARDRRRD